MTADDVVSLLEENWTGIREHLGDSWGSFFDGYAAIVAEVERDEQAVGRAVDDVCRLMARYEYTQQLLRRMDSQPSAERAAPSGASTLRDRETYEGIHNRFGKLVEKGRSEMADRRQEEIIPGRDERPPPRGPDA
jgi:hypothetical protein